MKNVKNQKKSHIREITQYLITFSLEKDPTSPHFKENEGLFDRNVENFENLPIKKKKNQKKISIEIENYENLQEKKDFLYKFEENSNEISFADNENSIFREDSYRKTIKKEEKVKKTKRKPEKSEKKLKNTNKNPSKMSFDKKKDREEFLEGGLQKKINERLIAEGVSKKK